MDALTWKIWGELCIRIAWKVEATPIPIMPSRECRWSAFIVLLSSSEVFSNDEFSIMTKHLKNKLQLKAKWIVSFSFWKSSAVIIHITQGTRKICLHLTIHFLNWCFCCSHSADAWAFLFTCNNEVVVRGILHNSVDYCYSVYSLLTYP